MSDKDNLEKINSMKEDIIENYDRLEMADRFTFSCDPNVPCFGQCCRDINILESHRKKSSKNTRWLFLSIPRAESRCWCSG